MNFVAIDFETATGNPASACAIGLVEVDHGEIIREEYRLIQPPNNYYSYHNILVHGITPEQTANQPAFEDVIRPLLPMIEGKVLVAHNEPFDRRVMRASMAYYDMFYEDFDLPDKWQCTCRIYRAKGFKPASLNACSTRMGIELNHHHALSDAQACAQLYIHHLGFNF